MIGSDPAAAEGPLPGTVWVGTGGAPPTPSLLEEMGRLNFAPKRVIFAELPKTSTGKIQKTVLRERSRTLAPRSTRR